MLSSRTKAAARLIALWNTEKDRVERYADEAGLEEKFTQPIFEILGWAIKYQPYLEGREPDYALFITDEKLNDALRAGRAARTSGFMPLPSPSLIPAVFSIS